MKRLMILGFSVLLFSGLAIAQDAMNKSDDSKMGKMKGKMMSASGTVTKVDESGKMMMMKNSKGKEMEMHWDGSTKVTGKMMEGSKATVQYMMMDGKMMAHSVKMTGGKMKPKM
ncbi:MAG: hypothetical protein M3R62_15170 [Acidobacteriota bacterium]|nr:hypothetical protein [Acidobacteriota bacterium]